MSFLITFSSVVFSGFLLMSPGIFLLEMGTKAHHALEGTLPSLLSGPVYTGLNANIYLVLPRMPAGSRCFAVC